jgi:hypothetical protein
MTAQITTRGANVGKAQEKAHVFRTEKRRAAAEKRYPWIIRSTVMVNHYYLYILDRDVGPIFSHSWPFRQSLAGYGFAHRPIKTAQAGQGKAPAKTAQEVHRYGVKSVGAEAGI